MGLIRGWLDGTALDTRFALRSWRKAAGVNSLVVLMLAVAIGSTTAVFSVVKAILLDQLPYRDPDRVVALSVLSGAAAEPAPASFATITDWQAQNHLIESISVYGDSSNVTFENGQARVLRGMRVSWNFFDTLGAQVQIGRTFRPDEELLGHDHEIILTHALWLDLFGGDPNAVGRSIGMPSLGAQVRVIGILPENFHPPHMSNPIEWPGYFRPLGRDPSWNLCRSCRGWTTIARMKPGVRLQQARADLNGVLRRLVGEYPNDYPRGAAVAMIPLRDATVGKVRSALWIVLASVVLVLLIAAANAANLLLARSAAREKEMAIRSALGSGRGRIIRQLLTEAILLALLAGLLGVLLAFVGIHLLRPVAPREIPRVDEVRMDPAILWFGVGISLVTGVLCGLAPAWRASRADLVEALKQSVRSRFGPLGWKLRDLLVVAQIALGFVLVAGTVLLANSLIALVNVDPGFDFHNVLTLSMVVYGDRYSNWDATMNYYRQVREKVQAIPGVEGVAMAPEFPLSNPAPTPIRIEERPLSNDADAPLVNSSLVSPEYFQLLKIPLKRGRAFLASDTLYDDPVAIISESGASTLFPREDPLGKHIRLGASSESSPWATIVGIVGDVRNEALDRAGDIGVYRPQAQVESYYRMLVRTRGDPLAFVPAIREAFHDVDASQPIWHILPMEAYVKSSYAERTFTLALLGIFGTLSLLLAAVGIYGLVSYTVNLRTREFGIRMALGAQRGAISGMILREVSLLLGCGLAGGAVAALIFTRFLAHLLFAVWPTDLGSSAAAVLILAATALIAGYLPSRRAAAVDPASALRFD
jgi:putative ABC transport system permease protein